MFRTLYAKLAIVLITLLTVLGVLYSSFNLYDTELLLQELNQRFNRDLARQLLVQQNLAENESLDERRIKAIFAEYMHINPAIEIYLLDPQGHILAFEAPENRIKRRQINMTPVLRFLSGDQHYPLLGDDPRDLKREKVFSAAAYPLQGEPRQYLYVVLSGEAYDNLRTLLNNSHFMQSGIKAVIVSLIIGLLAGLYAFNLLTRRLHRLADRMEQFRLSGFRQHQRYSNAPPSSLSRHGDEIETLGVTFDQMADTIIEQVRSLEKKDSLRRNLVANVSHDLRTPLASLQGYLETLLMKQGIADEKRHEYLEIAFQHGERLTRLVSELFELSKLEANEAQPQLEPVALGELVHDVAQQYALRAEQQQIFLTTNIATALPFVSADIAMINRVLENLLDNALAHTPQGGEIVIEITMQTDGVATAITNSGASLNKEELSHLWERFYQAPERRHGSGAGLGLAIVKHIIELHGTEPHVESSEEKGVTFSFTLPVWHS